MKDRITMYEFFLSFASRTAGRACRRCTEPIASRDLFGRSEGVCAGCRA